MRSASAIWEEGTPTEAILGTATALGAGTIVMGAYGHSGIREIFGFCTKSVLANCPKMLLLHCRRKLSGSVVLLVHPQARPPGVIERKEKSELLLVC